jgi:uncharacterized protein (TIGR02145 family)
VWQELQTVSTSALGLFTVQLGSSVALTNVNWANGSKFMQVELDLGSGFVDIGTQQLLSVPYALYGGEAGNGFAEVSSAGDTLYLTNGNYIIVPGISNGNNYIGESTTTGTTLHSCGALNVHNPNLVYGSVTDQEGNVYKTIVIGSQEWMAENLNTGTYNNGDIITANLNAVDWANATEGSWSYNSEVESLFCPYGKLYNWQACVDARQLCPTGWHVPSNDEWTILRNYLGGGIAGGKMKTIGTIETSSGLWLSPNPDATNFSGFSGVPGGSRGSQGGFDSVGNYGAWWSSTEFDGNDAWFRALNYNNYNFDENYSNKNTGYSVRCLRD